MKSFFSSFTILILVSNFSFSQYKWELGFSSGAGITKNRMLTFPENSSIRSSFSSNLKARYNCAKHFYVSGSLMYVLQGNNYQGWFLGASNEDLFSSQDYIHRRRQDYILTDISPGVQFGEKTGLNLEIGIYSGRLMNAEGKLISKETPSTVLVRENETEDYSTKYDFGLKSRIAIYRQLNSRMTLNLGINGWYGLRKVYYGSTKFLITLADAHGAHKNLALTAELGLSLKLEKN